MFSPCLYWRSVSASPLNSCTVPSVLRTVIMPLAGSTRSTLPLIFSGAGGRAVDAFPRADADGWQFGFALLLWASAGPPAMSAAATTAAVSVNVFMAASLFLRDVVDRAGGGTNARADQRTFSSSVAGARADRGARASTDGSAGCRAAPREGQAQHGYRNDRCQQSFHVGPPVREGCKRWTSEDGRGAMRDGDSYVRRRSSQPCGVTRTCSPSRASTVVVADSKTAG